MTPKEKKHPVTGLNETEHKLLYYKELDPWTDAEVSEGLVDTWDWTRLTMADNIPLPDACRASSHDQ